MSIIGGLVLVALLVWYSIRFEDKLKNNFITMEVRIDLLENKIRDLEHFDAEKDKQIKGLESRIHELDKKLFEFENAYRQ
ncbi:hypothetical protein SB581_12005 [Acinetobacter baumannii]|nr:hypothetical protein SB581_12005 [Acinetobacter baumannii]